MKEESKDLSNDMELSGSGLDRRSPWEYIEEVMAVLKTAFPLLALTMETMADQILQRLKPSADEDIYRLIVALLNDGVQVLSIY